MATFNHFNSFIEYVFEGAMNLGTDTLKVMLSNTAPSATMISASEITEIATGNGYTAGGNQATISSSAQSGGDYTLTVADVTFTASGGSMGPFRYAVFYDDTPAAPPNPLIGWFDYGTSISIGNTETFTWDAATSGVLSCVQASST
jgi:hypothetical protein